MGNICRSPSAEGFFRRHLERTGLAEHFVVDSAGTHSYHVGHAPDERAVREAAKFDVNIASLRARKVDIGDFSRFHHIIGMDRNNLDILTRLAPSQSQAKLSLMMQFSSQPAPAEVPDPYYGTQSDFTYMCQLLDTATRGLLEHLSVDFPPA
jgi:protein-tyrosine phosphatase